jgi:small basic protein
MWLPLLGLVAGVLLGLVLRVNLPIDLARYTAVGILAALDSLLGAYRAELEGHFSTRIFLSGFYTNAVLAAALTFLGDRLGIDLYLVALFAFGWRIFQNVAVIRRHFL